MKRETQIYKTALRLACEYLCDLGLVATVDTSEQHFIEKAEERNVLSDNQKDRLRERIKQLEDATGHDYTEITFINDVAEEKKYVRLGFEITELNSGKKIKYDFISGWFLTFVNCGGLVENKLYQLEDLL